MWIDRWAGLASAMAIQACGGLTYTFAVYSEHLKEALHYTQEQTDDIGAAKDFGYSLGIMGGLLYNFYPPFVTVSVGALLHFVGYMMVLLTITRQIAPPFWLLCTSIATGVGGDSWMDAACLFTNLQNFQEYRGTVMGILKAEIGLSGAIFVTIYKAFLEPDVDKYVLLVAVGPTITSLLLALFIRPYLSDNSHGNDQANVKRRFQLIYGAILALALFLLVTIVVQALVGEDLARSVLVAFAVIMLSIMGLTLVIPVLYRPLGILRRRLTGEREVAYSATAKGDDTLGDEGLGNGHTMLKPIGQGTDGDKLHGVRNEDQVPLKGDQEMSSEAGVEKGLDVATPENPDLTLWKALQSLNFWLLALLMMTGPGCGLAVINNLSQMGKAVDVDEVDLYVGLFSIWSCFGRLIAGYGSDSVLRRGVPRPLCLGAAHLTMMFGCLLLATGSVHTLALGSALVGLAYGAFWSLFPCIISEVFGLRQFAAIYKSVASMGPIGAYILSAKVVGYMYDREVIHYHRQFPNRQWSAEDLNTCYGPRCFGFSLVFLAMVALIGIVGDLLLAFRTNGFYQRLRARFVNSSH